MTPTDRAECAAIVAGLVTVQFSTYWPRCADAYFGRLVKLARVDNFRRPDDAEWDAEFRQAVAA